MPRPCICGLGIPSESMTKDAIIFKTLQESNTADEDEAIERLKERIPEGESKTCGDFKYLGVQCCDTCHRFLPETEMYLESLRDGGTAWICCAIRSSLLQDTKL